MFDIDDVDEAKRMLPIYKRAVDVLETVSGKKTEQEEQKPVAVVEITYGREPECYVTGNIDDFPEGVFKLYAAPVRTKDLTDDEIAQAVGSPLDEVYLADFRAVIAADREKNRG